jgi:hypothetical protein
MREVIGQDSIQPNGREQRRQSRKAERQRADQAIERNGVADLSDPRPEVFKRQRRIEPAGEGPYRRRNSFEGLRGLDVKIERADAIPLAVGRKNSGGGTSLR